MVDLHELYGEAAAKAMLELYERDKLGEPGAIPVLPIMFVDRSAKIGTGSKIWHFARVLSGVVIGEHCSIGGGTEIGRGCYIGDRTRIGANCFLPPDTKIGESVFVGPGVTMCDDKFPKVPDALDPPYNAQPPVIGSHAVIGASVVILPGVIVGEYARIGAGSIVTKDVPAHTMVVGTPAKVVPTMPLQWSERDKQRIGASDSWPRVTDQPAENVA